MSLKKLYTAFVAIALGTSVFAQQSPATDNEGSVLPTEKSTNTLKPRVGLHAGTLTFLGDVGAELSTNTLGTSPFAYRLSAGSPINSYLDIELYALFGQSTINERAKTPRNFTSSLRAGGATVKYNFDHFLPSNRNIQPFISVGLESIEFLTKMDLQDAHGQSYHYWSDGSIRNLDENDIHAGSAQKITRDYVYESDARDLDLHGYGKYTECTFSMPVGLGAEMFLTERFRATFAAEMHFTFSDYIDNVADDQSATAITQKGNDRFFYAYAGLSYDLNVSPPNNKEEIYYRDENGQQSTVTIDMDGDKDGVNDLVDQFFGAPDYTPSDARGIPLDSDKDGVADYIDEEPNTPAGNIVDNQGVTLSDEDIYHRYLLWTDSIPYVETRWKEDFLQKKSDFAHASRSYSVNVEMPSNGLTQAEINLLLSFKQVQHIKTEDSESYLIGAYSHLTEAIQTQRQLSNEGVSGKIMENNRGELSEIGQEEIAEDNPSLEEISQLDKQDEVIYRVQIGAFRSDVTEDIFKDIPELLIMRGEDGLTRYTSGSFHNKAEAVKWKTELLLQNFEGAFITAYKSRTRISLADAGMQVSNVEKDKIVDEEQTAIDPALINFKILLGSYENLVPTNILETYLKIGNVRAHRSPDGQFLYMTGDFSTVEEAENHLTSLQNFDLGNPIIVGSFNGKIIDKEEAIIMKKQP